MNMKKPAPVPVAPEASAHNDSMRRLQIGIAGVMAVLLLVGLAGLIGDRARKQVENDAVAANPAATGTTDKGSGAPLEELGVQPVTPTAEGAAATAPAAAKTAPMQPASAKVPDLEPDPELQRARSKTAQ
jgi:hypothetical protein